MKITLILIFCVAIISFSAGCLSLFDSMPTPAPSLPPLDTPPPSSPDVTAEPLVFAPYNGTIEHIFFHEVIAWPELAFNGNSRQENLDAEYVTAEEFWKILTLLHENKYVLVNLNDVYSEYMTDTGQYKIRQNTLDLPQGRKALVISFDNMNFNQALIPFGFMSKYVIGSDGEIWAEGTDPDGNVIVSQDLTAITLLDKFVRENPDFSPYGAKGCLALTGVQGILGYRTNKVEYETPETRVNRMREVALALPVVEKLKQTGWYFGSHTYSRNYLGNMTVERVVEDAQRWRDEVGALVGETSILTYPGSSRLDGNDLRAPGPAFQYYVSIGFRYFAAYGSQHFVKFKSDDFNIVAIIADRASMGGTSFRYHGSYLSRFFDVREVFDPSRPDYGNTWESLEPNDDDG